MSYFTLIFLSYAQTQNFTTNPKLHAFVNIAASTHIHIMWGHVSVYKVNNERSNNFVYPSQDKLCRK